MSFKEPPSRSAMCPWELGKMAALVSGSHLEERLKERDYGLKWERAVLAE